MKMQPVSHKMKHAGAMIIFATVSLCHEVIGGTAAESSQTKDRVYAGRSLAQWHERLKNIDPTTSNAMVLVNPLIAILEDDTLRGVDREPFAAYLGRIGSPARRAVPVLARIIDRRQHDPANNYIWAARALALMGQPGRDATPALVDLLFDDQLPVSHRQSAIEAVARIGGAHPDAIPALLQLLQYRASSRVTASDAATMRYLAAESMFLVGPAAEIAAPLLIRMIRNPLEAERTRRSAIAAIGSMASAGAVGVPALSEELIGGQSPSLRDAAAEALVKIGEAAIPTLSQCLEHPDAEVRWRIAYHVRILTAPSAVIQTKLVELLDDPQPIVRISAAESLSKLTGGSEQVISATIQLLSEADRRIRIRAKNLLVTQKPIGKQHMDRLRQMSRTQQGVVGKSVEVTLRELGE